MKTLLWNVRYPSCTVNIPIKKYFDSDSMKFIRDKLDKIMSHSLGDIIDDKIHINISYLSKNDSNRWFIPKDNDFE